MSLDLHGTEVTSDIGLPKLRFTRTVKKWQSNKKCYLRVRIRDVRYVKTKVRRRRTASSFLLGFLFVRHDHPFFAYPFWCMVIFFWRSKVLTWLYSHSLVWKRRLLSYTCQFSTFLDLVRPSSLFELISPKSKATKSKQRIKTRQPSLGLGYVLDWPVGLSRPSRVTSLTDGFLLELNPSVAVFVIFWWSCRSYYRDHHFKSESPVKC